MITGDRVEIGNTGQSEPHYLPRPAHGREQVRFQQYEIGAHRYVVPTDAAYPVMAGRLDERLFDVTELGLDQRGSRIGAPGAPRSGPVAAAALHRNLTIEVLDRRGRPAESFIVICVNVATGERCPFAFDRPHVLTARVPEGRYFLLASITTPADGAAAPATAVLTEPDRPIEADTRIVLDSRKATQVEVSADRPDAVGRAATVTLFRHTPAGRIVFSTSTARAGELYLAPTAEIPPADLWFVFGTAFGRRGDPKASPWFASVVFDRRGAVPVPRWRIETGRLARVDARYAAQGTGQTAEKYVTPAAAGWFVGPPVELAMALPARRAEYYSPGPWSWETIVNSFAPGPGGNGQDRAVIGQQWASRVRAQAGRSVETWNSAVIGPGLPAPDTRAERTGDELSFLIPLNSDQEPTHAGFLASMTGTTRLYRGQALVGTGDVPFGDAVGTFTVPPGRDRYRLVVQAARPLAAAPLSARMSAEWTFDSEHPPAGSRAVLPLSVVRFAPRLDGYNRAPAGEFTVPLYVQNVPGAPVTPVRELTVQASYDDGASWAAGRLEPAGSTWNLRLRHPATARYVSLRAQMSDGSGSTVTQTVLRAYEVRVPG